MDTKTMGRSHRKAVKRAIRKLRRARPSQQSPAKGAPLSPSRLRLCRTRLAFASAWNGAVRAGGLRLPLISGITLLPYAVAALSSGPSATESVG